MFVDEATPLDVQSTKAQNCCTDTDFGDFGQEFIDIEVAGRVH